jgi:hypothetical protein
MKFIQIGNDVINLDQVSHVTFDYQYGTQTGIVIQLTSTGPQGTGKYIFLSGPDADKARDYFTKNSEKL